MKVLPFSPPTYLVKMFASNRRSKQELVHILPFKCFYEKMAQFAHRSTAAITHLAAAGPWLLLLRTDWITPIHPPYIHPFIHSYLHLHCQNCGYKPDSKMYSVKVSFLCSGGNPNMTPTEANASMLFCCWRLLRRADCRLYS